MERLLMTVQGPLRIPERFWVLIGHERLRTYPILSKALERKACAFCQRSKTVAANDGVGRLP